MNDEMNLNGMLYVDSSSMRDIIQNSNLFRYGAYGAVDSGGEVTPQVDETSQLKKLLDSLKDTEAEEYIDIVIEFLRRRLVMVLDNPDMVDNLDKLRKLDSLDSLDLADRISYMESEIDRLRASLSEVTTKLDKLLAILKNGQEEIRYL